MAFSIFSPYSAYVRNRPKAPGHSASTLTRGGSLTPEEHDANEAWYAAGNPPQPTAPTSAPTTSQSGLFNKPGPGEDWYSKYGSEWNKPTQSSGYWQGVQGYFGNAPSPEEQGMRSIADGLNGPSAMGALWPSIQQKFSGPGRVQTYATDHAGTFADPGAFEQAWEQNKQFFQSPGDFEKWWTANRGAYDKPGAAEDYYANHKQDIWDAPGAMERYATNNTEGLLRPGELAMGHDDVMGNIDQAQTMADFFGKNRGQLEKNSYAENYAQGFDPNAKGYSENLYEQGNQGLNQFYDQAYKQGSRRLDEAAAARGGFNSGAALRSIQELNTDLGAQQSRDMASLAGQADQQRLARQTLGGNLSSSADTSLRGRLDLGFQGATGVDTIALARAKAKQDLYSKEQDERYAGVKLGGDLANSAQSSALARGAGGMTAAGAAQTAAFKRLGDAAGISKDVQAAAFGRMDDFLKGELQSQNSAEGRVKSGAEIEKLASDEARAIADELMKGARDTDISEGERTTRRATLLKDLQSMIMERLGKGATIAGDVDKTEQSRLIGAQGSADLAQNEGQNREHQAFTDILGAANAQAAALGGVLSDSAREQLQIGYEGISAQLQAGKITEAQANQQYQDMMKLLTTPGYIIPAPGKGTTATTPTTPAAKP